jgi:hypothetical protein
LFCCWRRLASLATAICKLTWSTSRPTLSSEMAPSRPNTPSSLPGKPGSSHHHHHQPSSSSSLRKVVHRKRSVSPAPSASGSTTSEAEASASAFKKGRYERPGKQNDSGPPPSLLSHALGKVKNDTPVSTPTCKTAGSGSVSASGPATPSTARAQFEQQEDFISFDFDEPPSPPRFTPGGKRGAARDTGASGGKRKLDEYEEKAEEGSRRMQKRERERTTPWCEEPGVDWASCKNAIGM